MIGVLALQGAFEKHAFTLQKLGIKTVYVRRPDDLKECIGLIIPGGESTTMRHLLQEVNLLPALKEFSINNPVFGTCAGLILMAIDLELLDVDVQRNGFGSQVYSFSSHLESEMFTELTGIFIRAPRICKCGKNVSVLATYQKEPVLVRQGIHMAATFHPELTDDLRVHQEFVSMVKDAKFPTDYLFSNIENDHEVGDGLPAKTQIG